MIELAVGTAGLWRAEKDEDDGIFRCVTESRPSVRTAFGNIGWSIIGTDESDAPTGCLRVVTWGFFPHVSSAYPVENIRCR